MVRKALFGPIRSQRSFADEAGKLEPIKCGLSWTHVNSVLDVKSINQSGHTCIKEKMG